MLSVATLTHPGLVRANNEDGVLWDPQIGLLAIADGMGGHNAGEIASRLALEILQQALRTNAVASRARWPFGFADASSLAVNRLRTAIRLANREVFRASQERVEYSGMGTTLTAAVIEKSHVWFGSVGDTRLYATLPGEQGLQQMTRDDSFVGLLADAPGVEPSMLADHPMRHLLTSVLGPRADIEVEVEETILTDGQMLLMTTDGLHGAVGDELIRDVLGAETDLRRAAERLVQAALDAGGRDNITLALARYSAA